MKEKLKIVAIFLVCIQAMFGIKVVAQEEGSNDLTSLKEEVREYSSDFVKPGILPNSPIYFLDKLGESVGIGLARYPDKKSEKAIKYAEEKISELIVISTSETDDDLFFVGDSLDLYNEYIDVTITQIGETEDLGVDIDEVAEDVATKALLNIDVLDKLHDLYVLKEKLNLSYEVEEAVIKSFEGNEAAIAGIRKDPELKGELDEFRDEALDKYEEKYLD